MFDSAYINGSQMKLLDVTYFMSAYKNVYSVNYE